MFQTAYFENGKMVDNQDVSQDTLLMCFDDYQQGTRLVSMAIQQPGKWFPVDEDGTMFQYMEDIKE